MQTVKNSVYLYLDSSADYFFGVAKMLKDIKVLLGKVPDYDSFNEEIRNYLESKRMDSNSLMIDEIYKEIHAIYNLIQNEEGLSLRNNWDDYDDIY